MILTTEELAFACRDHLLHFQEARVGSTHLAFLKNPDSPDARKITPIHCAVIIGSTQIIKILAPLTENPNVPNKSGDIYLLQFIMLHKQGVYLFFCIGRKK